MSGAAIFPLLPIQEVETFSKPGTADVTAGDRKKLSGLLKHYAGMAHPFSACKRDQIKHGLSADHANRRCAVIKDLIRGNTKWRGKAKEEAEAIIAEAVEVVTVAIEELGRPVVERLVEDDAGVVAEAAALVEVAAWMVPAAAKRSGFKPIKPESKSSTSSSSDFEKKHPRGQGATGGQFIRKGASNQAVIGVQKKLGVKTTGTYGGLTIQAVKKYQRQHGLQVDGVIGQQTASSLLGKSAMKPGAMSSGLRHALKRLGSSGKMQQGELQERTVHVETREDEPGVKIATIPKIRNALYDLSEPRNPTHTVQLPHGTKITVKPGVPTRTFSSFGRTFVITAADGETSKEAIGSDDAAELAKEMDGAAGKRVQEAMLSEAAVRVSGYTTKRGRHVGAYSQIRAAIAKLSDGGAAHFPDGITVKQASGGYEVYGGGRVGTGISTSLSLDKAAGTVAIRSADSTHPKSLGGKSRHQDKAYAMAIKGDHAKTVNDIPADNPRLPGTPHPEFVADRAAKARKAAKLPSRKERAENERKAGERKTADNMKKNGGDALANFDLGGPKAKSTKRSRDGAKRLADDNAAMAKRDARERREKARRRANDESPMPGVIRKPSESDEIRAREGRKRQARLQKDAEKHASGGGKQKTPGYNSRLKIFFKNDKGGKVRAYYWSRPLGSMGRMIPIGKAKADKFIANGEADKLSEHPLKGLREEKPVIFPLR